MRILITCFMPFRGRRINGSQTLAHDLKSRCPDLEIHVVEIPVRWGAVEETVLPMIAEWQPELLVGLGEGGKDTVAIETLSRNALGGHDVDGVAPAGSSIIRGGDPERTSRLTFTWSSEISLAAPVMLSLSAGDYLCNNALYAYLGTGVERAGFVHVPPQGDERADSYCARLGPIVEEIVRQNARLN